ncbi:hypothetical protein [Bifidobacterium sp. ESL0790]|uniref:hypothetical protein n=1 Tax=Bifidobacterium sp. ESL0790 TaxID=2983233 RepID=UPI0023F6FDB8|nr:hypothetical protein [Bifidobacterium sp. ESL0790]WEV72116.1 hypothetical protein OZY47_06665 [Bifidobacterium sp. ESL0790]
MATKVDWGSVDYASQEVLDDLYIDSGHSYRRVEELTEERSDTRITYNRVRDICLGRRSSVRLSELVALCSVYEVDPVATLKKILNRAAEIRAQDESEQVDNSAFEIDAVAEREAKIQAMIAHPEEYTLVAHRDPNKEAEMETPQD